MYKWRAQNLLQAGSMMCSVDRQRIMESGNKIVSADVYTVPSCELAASSSVNSLPGSSFMVVNTDMMKAL